MFKGKFTNPADVTCIIIMIETFMSISIWYSFELTAYQNSNLLIPWDVISPLINRNTRVCPQGSPHKRVHVFIMFIASYRPDLCIDHIIKYGKFECTHKGNV